MQDFDAYAIGPMVASVCSSLSPTETVERMNTEHPTGISSAWSLAPDERFASGQPNPCACERRPETHRHYLLEC